MSRWFGLATTFVVIAASQSATQAAFLTYVATMSGMTVSSTSSSIGTGVAQLGFDLDVHTIRVQVTFSGLSGPAVNAVIHGPTSIPGTGKGSNITNPNFPSFPVGGTSGSYDQTFSTLDASFFSAAFVANNGGTAAGAEAALLNGLAAGTIYFDIHTFTTPNIEIAGFFAPATTVPEPASLLLLGIGTLGLGAGRFRR